MNLGGELNIMDRLHMDNNNMNSNAELTIEIVNVVCEFHVRCHINLRRLALNGLNVEYKKDKGMLVMKIRRPYVTASIRNSGFIQTTGSKSEEDARTAARRVARILQKLGFKVKFTSFKVKNVLGVVHLPFGVRVDDFCKKNRQARYEPELHSGIKMEFEDCGATMTIFSTGKITILARNIEAINKAVHQVWPLVHESKKDLIPMPL